MVSGRVSYLSSLWSIQVINSSQTADRQFQLCFRPLSQAVMEQSFPCDASGSVDMDRLRAGDRLNYLFARATIGRDFGRPTVRQAAMAAGFGRSE
jgi:hypothetical protein